MTARDDLRDALMAGYVVEGGEPLHTEAEADALIDAATGEAVSAVQSWMALDLHMALGKPVDHSASTVHQGRRSWADWWAELCAEVRSWQPTPGAETVTEWAVRLVDGEILERPDQRAALKAALGSSEVVSRQVTRTRWQPICKRCHGRGYVPDFSNGLNEYGEPGKKPCPECQRDQQRADDTARAVHLGHRSPAGRLIYLANQLETALNNGTLTPAVLATIHVLRTTAAELEGEQP